MSEFILDSSNDFFPDQNEDILSSIFKQYEKVIVHSIITSFGLDFLINDHLGGDVDTIHNVRKNIYQSTQNKSNYESRGNYNSYEYHSDVQYVKQNRQVSKQKQTGRLYDAYTGDNIPINGKVDLDHIISANEIHNDPGRILAGLKGTELANNEKNLCATNPHTNRTKKALTMDEFLEKYGDEYTSEQKERMHKIDAIARKEYDVKIFKEYYTSATFVKDTMVAAGKLGVNMGLRQLLGFIFTEIWFSVKEEFERLNISPGLDMDMGDFFIAIAKGVQNGFSKAKFKYKELFEQFAGGTLAGMLSSLTTTICNIFFTTAKNVVKIIRNAYASIVEAGKIILINPENYPFGERMRAAVKVLATGASVVLGNVVIDAISKTPIAVIPIIGNAVKDFCGTLCTGILSCTFLFYLDKSKVINLVVEKLNKIHTIEDDIYYYQQQAQLFEKYAAELMMIDLNEFHHKTEVYLQISRSITVSTKPEELNIILKNSLHTLGVSMVWEKDYVCFDEFMNDKCAKMVFS